MKDHGVQTECKKKDQGVQTEQGYYGMYLSITLQWYIYITSLVKAWRQ